MLRQAAVIMRKTLYRLHDFCPKTLPCLFKVILILWPWIWEKVCVACVHMYMEICLTVSPVTATEISCDFHVIFYTFWYGFNFLSGNCISYLLLWLLPKALSGLHLLRTLQRADRWLCWSCLGSFMSGISWLLADLGWPQLGQLRWLCSTSSPTLWVSLAWRYSYSNGRYANKFIHGSEFQGSVSSHLLTHWPKQVTWLSSGSQLETF